MFFSRVWGCEEFSTVRFKHVREVWRLFCRRLLGCLVFFCRVWCCVPLQVFWVNWYMLKHDRLMLFCSIVCLGEKMERLFLGTGYVGFGDDLDRFGQQRFCMVKNGL